MNKEFLGELKKAVSSGDRWQAAFWLLVVFLFFVIGLVWKERSKIQSFINDVKEYRKLEAKLNKVDDQLQSIVDGVTASVQSLKRNRINFSNVANQVKSKSIRKRGDGGVGVEQGVDELQKIYDMSIQEMEEAIKIVEARRREAEILSRDGKEIIASSVNKFREKYKSKSRG
jgi:uncharacterized phage infection (PIP) family protein YhgE